MGPCCENCDFTTNQIIATAITNPKIAARCSHSFSLVRRRLAPFQLLSTDPRKPDGVPTLRNTEAAV